MWFRNLRAFRLDAGWTYDLEQLTTLLDKARFQPCGATDLQSHGWVPPRGIEGEMVISVGRQQLIALGSEQRLLPGSVVRQHVAERVDALEQQQGYKPGRGQLREIREQVTAELLPRAFVRRRLTYVWIDPVGRWLGIDVASAAKADEVVEQLKLALDALPLLPLRTALAPSTAMTQWLAEGDAPAGFSIDQDCELRSPLEDKATVRYCRHSLDVEEVRHHIEAGKKATRLALTWDDKVSFVLTEDMHVKRLAFLDVLKEQSEQQAGDAEGALFEADLAIMAGEFSRFLPALLAALGGEAEA
ncbi:recombination-associated protein RdgC [Denitratisoma sp. agr-D3]